MNFYPIPTLISATVVLILGFVVFTKNRKSNINVSFSLFCFFTFIWLFAATIAYFVRGYDIAFFWLRIDYVGVIFMGPAFFQFVVSFLKLTNLKKVISLYYIIGLFFVYFLYKTQYFIVGLYKYFWGYYPKAGFLHVFFLFFVALILLNSFILLFVQYKNKKYMTPIELLRLRYILPAFALCSFVCADFIPNYGIEMYPVGFSFAILFAMVISYAIIKYRLMDIEVIIKKTAIYGLFYGVVFGALIFLVLFWGHLAILGNIDKQHILLCMVTLVVTIITLKPLDNLLAKVTDKIFFRKRYEYQKALKEASAGISRIKDLDGILTYVFVFIMRHVSVTHAIVFAKQDDSFVLNWRAGKFDKSHIHETISKDSALLKHLKHKHDALICDELKLQSKQEQQPQDIEEIIKELDRFKAAICMPGFIGEELSAIFMLGSKLSDDIYTQDDINMLSTLSNQMALAIENARAQERLVESERLAAVGRLASSIAHEIKNPLTAIKIFTEYLNEKFGEQEFRDKFQRIVGGEVDRINSIVEQLNNFAHPKALKLEPTDLKEVIGDTLILMENSFYKRGIKVTKEYTATGCARADKNQMEQVFLNLFINAIDAMQESAVKELKIKTYGQAANIYIQISDSGTGIQKKNLADMFTPFYTTKERGMGLGLAIVKSIIEKHGGEIRVLDTSAKGTTFIIVLPKCK